MNKLHTTFDLPYLFCLSVFCLFFVCLSRSALTSSKLDDPIHGREIQDSDSPLPLAEQMEYASRTAHGSCVHLKASSPVSLHRTSSKTSEGSGQTLVLTSTIHCYDTRTDFLHSDAVPCLIAISVCPSIASNLERVLLLNFPHVRNLSPDHSMHHSWKLHFGNALLCAY